MATTESLSTDAPMDHFDADELGQYRSLSSLAVVSVVLGVFSAITFASPMLIVVPLAAAATALLALRSIATSGGGLSGRRLALVGLTLSVMFGVAAFARITVRDSLLKQQADQVCQQWLGLASNGQVDEMLLLMSKQAADRLKPAVEVAQPDSIFGGMLTSALMRQDPLVAALSDISESGNPSYEVQDAQILAAIIPAQARMRYMVSSSESDADVSCQIVLKRFRTADDQFEWFIDGWSVEN